MNAAIRAVVRAAAAQGIETVGVRDGLRGLVDGVFQPLDSRAVAGILSRGGTVLGTVRLPRFREPDLQRAAVERLRA